MIWVSVNSSNIQRTMKRVNKGRAEINCKSFPAFFVSDFLSNFFRIFLLTLIQSESKNFKNRANDYFFLSRPFFSFRSSLYNLITWCLTRNNISMFVSVLMKLSRPANLSPRSRVRTIFLPSSSHVQINPNSPPTVASLFDDDLLDRNENYLRKLDPTVDNLAKLIGQVNQNEVKKRQAGNKAPVNNRNATKLTKAKKHRRRNDKFLHRRPINSNDERLTDRDKFSSTSIDYVDCVAVGWGQYRNSGDLSDALLKIEVPIQNIKRCVVDDDVVEHVKWPERNSANFTFIKTQFSSRNSFNLTFQVRRGLFGFCFATSKPALVCRKHGRTRGSVRWRLGRRTSMQNWQKRALDPRGNHVVWVGMR